MSTSNYTTQTDDALCEEWRQENKSPTRYLAQKNTATDSKHLRKLPVKKYTCVCMCVSSLISYDHGQQTVQLYIHSCSFSHGMHRDSFNFIILGLQKFELQKCTKIWHIYIYFNIKIFEGET